MWFLGDVHERVRYTLAVNTPHQRWWQPFSQPALKLAFIVVTVVLLVDLIRSIDHNYQISRQIRLLTGRITAERDQAIALTEAIGYYQTSTYKELTARRELGLVKPGETLVLAPHNRDPASAGPGTLATTTDTKVSARQSWSNQPPYQQWWLLFFGPTSQLEAVFGS